MIYATGRNLCAALNILLTFKLWNQSVRISKDVLYWMGFILGAVFKTGKKNFLNKVKPRSNANYFFIERQIQPPPFVLFHGNVCKIFFTIFLQTIVFFFHLLHKLRLLYPTSLTTMVLIVTLVPYVYKMIVYVFSRSCT